MNLTLVDLPGLTKVAVGRLRCLYFSLIPAPYKHYKINLSIDLGVVEGQPESIVQDIENMVRSYIEKVILGSEVSRVFEFGVLI